MKHWARGLAMATGFLSLSTEILWVRLVGLAYRGAPQGFGLVLGVFLLGVALGAQIGKRFCRDATDLWRTSAWVLMLSAAVDGAAPFCYVSVLDFGRPVALLALLPLVAATAALKSIVFPIAHQLGTQDGGGTLGGSVSRVYFANILGSTAGPLVTGFVLLQVLTLQDCYLVIATLTSLTAILCASRSHSRDTAFKFAGAILAGSALALLCLLPETLTRTMLTRINIENESDGIRIGTVLENRYGVINSLKVPDAPDQIYGGNAYDGMVNTRLVPSPNMIERVYLLAALHPHPRHVLEIGLSVGSWAQVIAGMPGVAQLDIVEINPAYLALAARYPETRSLISNPRIVIHIDDGRRWLKRNPTLKFDAIVMNTTWHWRAYSSMLLSREFMTTLKQHLNAGGLVLFNSTESADAYATAADVFSHVYKFRNFVYASGMPLTDTLASGLPRMLDVSIDGYSPRSHDPKVLSALLAQIQRDFQPFEALRSDPQFTQGRPLELITDQNMLTEYRRGQSFSEFILAPN